MDGWMGGWMAGWLGGWMDGWMDGYQVDIKCCGLSASLSSTGNISAMETNNECILALSPAFVSGCLLFKKASCLSLSFSLFQSSLICFCH